MATTLEAPSRIGGRELPRELFEASDLPESLHGRSLVIEFQERALYTLSFVDELIFEALVHRKCEQLTLRGLSERLQQVAQDAADYHNVSNRLDLRP